MDSRSIRRLEKVLVSRVCAGVTQATASRLLGVSPKMIQRGKAVISANPAIQLGATQPKQKRKRIDTARHQLALQVLDTLAPVQSGRQWRVVRCTEAQLYQQYALIAQKLAPDSPPLSKSYFIEKVLDKKHNLVHHENTPDFCQLCQRRSILLGKKIGGRITTAEATEFTVLDQHYSLKDTQWRVYHRRME